MIQGQPTGVGAWEHTLHGFLGSLAKVMNKHTIKIGWDARHHSTRQRPGTDLSGSYRFNDDFTPGAQC